MKHSTVSLVLLAIYLNTWLPLDTHVVFVLGSPAAEDAQAILSTISDFSRDRAMKDAFLAGKTNEDIEIAQSLEGFIPRSTENDDGYAYYNGAGEFDKRRLRESKRRLRVNSGLFSEDKRRLRFVKRQEAGDDDVFSKEGAIAPRLRYHNLRRRDAV